MGNKSLIDCIRDGHPVWWLKMAVTLGKWRDLNRQESDTLDTALHVACQPSYYDFSLVEHLLRHGANPNLTNAKEETPLHIAAGSNNLSCTRLLYSHGCRVDLMDYKGRLPEDRTRDSRARFIAVSAEATPNPSAMIFTLEGRKPVLGQGAKSMSFEKTHCADSPLAASLFRVHGVDKVLLAARHATVTKSPETDWELLKPNVELVISQFFDIPNIKPVTPEAIEYTPEGQEQHNDDVINSIHEILEQRVKPFVEQDGGDVEFVSFDSESGELKIRLVGSCSGCPKSSVTLKFGIQRMVCHYIPEVKNVINIEEEEVVAEEEETAEAQA
ncbi:NFU1 iron-sulfur cluster scaffold [Perkinsus olseni]|nr:NFU1 iron-sulfur cluster scaffold [Perkinsus olseni]